MCGFNGIFGNDISGLNSSKRIKKMNDSIIHRGPDASGQYSCENISLGHRRLSIIDLDKRSNQPMISDDYIIVFNGEIFNYKNLKKEIGGIYKTDSDTEVIIKCVASKGIDWFLENANGMFAFALFNFKTKNLYLCRDRFGIKPLFYSITGDKLIFSSEIKGILSSGLVEAKFNYSKIEEYLSYRQVFEPNTFFKNIFQVESANYLEFDTHLNERKIKYWSLPNTFNSDEFDENQLTINLRNKLIESVNLWAISDVNIGAFLSGGLDSSLTSAILSQRHKNLMTYTIGFEEKDYNEFYYADLVSKHISSKHTQLNENINSYHSKWDELIYFKDSPLAVPNEVPLAVMCKELKKDFTVVISGEGADELFGGYGKIYKKYFDVKYSNKNLIFLDAFFKEYSYVEQSFIEKYFKNQENSVLDFGKKIYNKSNDDLDFTYRFFHSFHIKGLLNRVDMTSMYASVEARPPFLDHELIEFVYKNIPNQLKIKWKDKKSEDLAKNKTSSEYSEVLDIPKYILKKVSEEFLPDEIIYRKKMGFPVPLDNWFEELKKKAKQEFTDSEWLKCDNIDEMISSILQLKRSGQTLWMLLNIDKFYKKYFKKDWKW